ncbi:MAG: T9SS type A sorting domain-containing protein, partial [Ferruginibacter sp.]
RSGEGTGRIYTITTTCHDGLGNTSHSSTTVTVALGGMNAAITEEGDEKKLSVSVLNNPGRDYFTLTIQTSKTDLVNVRLLDRYGRVVELKNNISGSQQVQIGSSVEAGIYWVEVKQGKEISKTQVVKIK